jgi:hypothetical protein
LHALEAAVKQRENVAEALLEALRETKGISADAIQQVGPAIAIAEVADAVLAATQLTHDVEPEAVGVNAGQGVAGFVSDMPAGNAAGKCSPEHVLGMEHGLQGISTYPIATHPIDSSEQNSSSSTDQQLTAQGQHQLVALVTADLEQKQDEHCAGLKRVCSNMPTTPGAATHLALAISQSSTAPGCAATASSTVLFHPGDCQVQQDRLLAEVAAPMAVLCQAIGGRGSACELLLTSISEPTAVAGDHVTAAFAVKASLAAVEQAAEAQRLLDHAALVHARRQQVRNNKLVAASMSFSAGPWLMQIPRHS